MVVQCTYQARKKFRIIKQMLLLILISHSISLKVYAEEIKGAENEIVQLMFRASNLDKKVY